MINRLIRAIAGTFIILSVLLGMYVNENWYWFTIFVGANLLQSSIKCLFIKCDFKIMSSIVIHPSTNIFI
uniref:YgaP family membrane protein n=1 Tax=Flavobacterium sp. TaxID=239 RepID=UPI0040494811